MELTSNQREALRLGSSLADLAEEQAGRVTSYDGTEVTDVMWQHVSHFLLVKAFHCFRACLVMLREGYERETPVVLRSLVEALITLRYIAQDPVGRARLYLEYDFVARYRLMEGLKTHRRWAMGPDSSQVLKRRGENAKLLEEEYNAVKDSYKSKSQWSDKSIKDMAQSVGMGWEYDTVYADCCAHAHVSVRSINAYFQDGPRGLVVDMGLSFREVEFRAYTAASYVARIMAINKDELGRDIPGDLTDIVTKLQKLVAATQRGDRGRGRLQARNGNAT